MRDPDQRHARRSARQASFDFFQIAHRPHAMRRRCDSAARSTSASKRSWCSSAGMPDPAESPAKFDASVHGDDPASTSSKPTATRSCCSPATTMMRLAARPRRLGSPQHNLALYSPGRRHAAHADARTVQSEPARRAARHRQLLARGRRARRRARPNVIITKLPFSVPDHPLLEARLEAIRAARRQSVQGLSTARSDHQTATRLRPPDPHRERSRHGGDSRSAREDEAVWANVPRIAAAVRGGGRVGAASEVISPRPASGRGAGGEGLCLNQFTNWNDFPLTAATSPSHAAHQ